MCGLAGIYTYDKYGPAVNPEELIRIRDHMKNRGPDGAGSWISTDQNIGLAHRRLSIIDLSNAGAQPMCDPDTGDRIVFNGEIYNYQSLRGELKASGASFHSHSDTEVLLKLYATRGQEMLQELRGMYAFAIWDNAKQGIFLARDPFGIKPLYIGDDGKTLRFASQAKALLAGNGIDTTPEPAGHVGFFLWGHVPEPYTLYKGISALPAGTSLWVDHTGRKSPKVFFDLTQELTQLQQDSLVIKPQDAKEQLCEALLNSVRHHLIADVSVGVFLSAGLDSATIAGLVTEIFSPSASCKKNSSALPFHLNTKNPDKKNILHTLTLGFKEFANTEHDEVPLAETLARHYGSTHTSRSVSKEDFHTHLDNLLLSMDQPSIDGVNTYFISLAAKEAGLKVALSGLGGDELFAGYSSFQDIPKMINLFSPIAKIPYFGRGLRYIAAPFLKQHTSPKYAGLFEFCGDYAGAYLLRRGLFMPWELPKLLDEDMIKEGWKKLRVLPALQQTIAGVKNPRLRITALETAWYMRNQLLRDTDWASMAHSLEVRVPLVDIMLFRTVTRLLHAGFAPGKQDMAKSAKIPLPDAVIQRKKTGFSVPVKKWLTEMLGVDCANTDRGLRSWALYLARQKIFRMSE
jgi:asparagine synthase (glutamine-hydrolysing)